MTLDPSRALELVRAVIAGDPRAAAEFVAELEAVVQARVARVLLRSGASDRSRLEHDQTDYMQDAFAMLLDDRARALAAWDPEAGRSLENYVGQSVEWFVSTRVRSLRVRRVDGVDADAVAVGRSALEHRDQLRRLLDAIEAKWPAFGLQMFYQLFVLQASSKQVGAEMGLGSDAVDQWRCRMRAFSRGFLGRD